MISVQVGDTTKTPGLFSQLQDEKEGGKNYFTSSDPHHDMSGGGCQARVVI